MSGFSALGFTAIGLLPASGDASAPGATLTGTSSLTGGAASGSSGANASGATLTGTSSISGGAATGGGAPGTINITSPASYQVIQRNVSTGLANITVAGQFTGAPTGIQARFNGGAWQTIVASPSGSAYSGTLTNCPTGQGLIEVRFTNDVTVTASRIKVGVGDIYIVGGQSNNSGRAASAVQPVNTNLTACEFSSGNAWIPLQEATTQAGSFDDLTGNPYSIRNGQATAGSWFGAVSAYWDAIGVPVAFVPCAVGSTVISSWQPGTPHTNTAQYYGVMLTRANLVGDHRALIFWQGESDASSGTTQAAYQTALAAMIDAWYADTGRKTIICKICNSGNSGTLTQIRAGQDYVAANDANVLGLVDMNVWASGNVHYSSTTEINAVAAAFWGAMGLALYPAAGATPTGTASISGGAATGGGTVNGTGSGATLTGTSSISGGTPSADVTEPGAALTGTSSITPGGATALNPGQAPGATLTGTASISGGAAQSSSAVIVLRRRHVTSRITTSRRAARLG